MGPNVDGAMPNSPGAPDLWPDVPGQGPSDPVNSVEDGADPPDAGVPEGGTLRAAGETTLQSDLASDAGLSSEPR